MNRFKYSELSIERLKEAGVRRVRDIPHFFAWNMKQEARENQMRLLDYKNRHKGQRCFVMGNGPSLAQMDLSSLDREFSFGTNRIYLLFDQIPFAPSYYVSVNELVLQQFFEEIATLPMPKFLNWNQREYFSRDASINFLRLGLGIRDRFDGDRIEGKISSGGTVTFVALQLAFWMGFSEVILIGVDHNFYSKGEPNKAEIRKQDVDKDHFHPDYFPKGSHWQLPDLRRSELAYQIALDAYLAAGRQIFDATINGKCQVFPKIDFKSLF
jgi:hypothetical protein